MRKLEMKFLTGLRKDFKRHGFYYYKIPDTPVSSRFQIAKPFDCFVGIGSGRGGMEAKYLDGDKAASVKLNDLRETQHKGLTEMIETGGQGWVFYQIKFGRENRLYFWEYQDFVRLCHLHGSPKCPKMPIKLVKTLNHVQGHKNRFDVLEYDLSSFEDHWHFLGELNG